MAKADGPYMPRSGWVKRWAIQGAQVLSRSPEAILLVVATVLVTGYVSRTVIVAASELTGLKILGITVSNIVTVPVGMIGIMLSLNALRHADRGERSRPEVLIAAGLPAIMSVTGFVAVLAGITMLFVLPAEMAGSLRDGMPLDAPGRGILAVILVRGATEVSTAIAMGLILHPFALGGVVLRGMDGQALRANAWAMRTRDIAAYVRVMAAVFIGHILVFTMPPVVQVPLLALYVAWFYVGAREVIDGDDQNGKVEAARRAVMDPT
ncbi:hypothetical protein [Paracoccus sp. ME4]|uniref:hypothetical protein n=1 Tax=Paracoccus sp. ME4 TaxID=3138066 RepID=UPI00398B501A